MERRTERYLRYRLALDLAPFGFSLTVVAVAALVGLLALFGGFVLRPLQNRLLGPQPSTQHVRSVHK